MKHPDLLYAEAHFFKPYLGEVKSLHEEAESKDYAATRFVLHQKQIVFRVAKITPNKIGQFVTLWKRNGDGPIMPLDEADQIDFVIVSTRQKDRLGQFIFPKKILVTKNVFSTQNHGGKRALRVYPPWDITISKQAKLTQAWQCTYFFELDRQVFDASRLVNMFAN